MLTSNYPRWANDTTTPFIHDLAVDMVKRNWDVTVLAPHAPGAKRRENLDEVEVRRFRYLLPERAQTVCYGGGALQNLRRSPLAHAKLPALVSAEWAATARVLGEGYDLLHAHWTLPQGFVAATTPRRHVPRVLTVHGGDVFGLRGSIVDRFASRALRSADRVTVATKATEAAVRDIAGDRVRVTRIPMGIDFGRPKQPELVTQLRARYRRSDGPLLVFVGRVVDDKGVADIVAAVRLLANELPGVTAAIVGDGPAVATIRDLAAASEVADRVFLPGWADPADVPSWFAAADVVVAPSRIGATGWEEGQGLSIIEAMAAGRPVVATRTGGIPETIADGATGMLVPPSDPAALASAVRRLATTPEFASAIGDRAAHHVRAEFNREMTSARMEEVYAEVIEARAAS